MNCNAKVLIQFDKESRNRKDTVSSIIKSKVGIPEELIDYLMTNECNENNQYDIVICLNKKNGEELKFPTVKHYLIKSKYELFRKN